MCIFLDPITHFILFSSFTCVKPSIVTVKRPCAADQYCNPVNKLCIEIHTDYAVSASEAVSICSKKGSRVISPTDVKSLYWLKQLFGEGDGCLLSKKIIRGNINVTALKHLGFWEHNAADQTWSWLSFQSYDLGEKSLTSHLKALIFRTGNWKL